MESRRHNEWGWGAWFIRETQALVRIKSRNTLLARTVFNTAMMHHEKWEYHCFMVEL